MPVGAVPIGKAVLIAQGSRGLSRSNRMLKYPQQALIRIWARSLLLQAAGDLKLGDADACGNVQKVGLPCRSCLDGGSCTSG